MRSCGSFSQPREAKYRTTELTTASTGTANSAPVAPKIMDPPATAKITASGCKDTALPIISGCRMCDSSCCTSSTMPIIMSACTGPRATSARRTATAPESKAPITGMNDPRNTSTPNGMASGTPKIAAPMPIPTASIAATRICTRTYAPRDFHPARPAPLTASRARRGRSPTINSQMRSPSMRKNTRVNRVIRVPVATSAAVLPTSETPRTMELGFSEASFLPCSSSWFSCSAPSEYPILSSQCTSSLYPSRALLHNETNPWASCCPVSATSASRPTIMPISAMAVAAPARTPRLRRAYTAGLSRAASKAATMSEITSRDTFASPCQRTHPAPATTSSRHDQAAAVSRAKGTVVFFVDAVSFVSGVWPIGSPQLFRYTKAQAGHIMERCALPINRTPPGFFRRKTGGAWGKHRRLDILFSYR